MPEDAMPTPSPVPPAAGQTATATPQAVESEKGLAAVAYILTWLTGLIILLVAQKEQRYVRWNAIQAIGLGIALFALSIVLMIIFAMLAFAGPAALMVVVLWPVFWILAIVLIILTAVKAYQGDPFRLPFIADFADKNA